tara:strand:+ start:2240 stop:2365 length:126 start_codon:yes stop_codon:yes gene_type:complete
MTFWEFFAWVAVGFGLMELSLVKKGYIKGIPDEVNKNEHIL